MAKGILFIGVLVAALNTSKPAYAQRSDLEAGLYNIGIGAVIGGIGAVVNKKEEDKWSKTFLKGFSQGALGGYLVFESKRLLREFSRKQDYTYIWPSKLVNSMGSSIIENSAANRDFWEQFHFTFGFNRFIFNFHEDFGIKYRIMPFTAFATIYSATEGKFDLKRSLQLGTFVFNEARTEFWAGTLGNNIIFRSNEGPVISIDAHEVNHIYQYENYSGFNSMLHPVQDKLLSRSMNFSWYQQIFYTDYNYLVQQVTYWVSEEVSGYDGNIFEREAYFFEK